MNEKSVFDAINIWIGNLSSVHFAIFYIFLVGITIFIMNTALKFLVKFFDKRAESRKNSYANLRPILPPPLPLPGPSFSSTYDVSKQEHFITVTAKGAITEKQKLEMQKIISEKLKNSSHKIPTWEPGDLNEMIKKLKDKEIPNEPLERKITFK